MERFTNDRNKYINEIESELINFIDENDFQTVFNYVEIPFFLNYAFSYNWSVNLKNNTFRLIFREWNAEYDNKRFNKGIYNLDRLAINEKQINLSEKEKQFIDSIEINKFQTNKFEGIILDGLMCSLIIPNKETQLKWNIDNEINYELFRLVNKLRALRQPPKTVKAKIYSHTKLIGETELSVTDESMGCLSGIFKPTELYKDVQKVFQTFHDNPKRYADLERIRLNVQLDNGLFLLPIGGIVIHDLKELPDEELVIDIAGVFRFVIADYFNNPRKQDFIVEPWGIITIEQKIGLENELRKEIGKKEQSFHPLAKYEFSAVASNCDDVLFAIHGHETKDHIVVHLTWKQSYESNNAFPSVEYFYNFNHFQETRMYPDRNEWL